MSPTLTLAYDFSSATAEPPTSNQLRFNAAAPYTAVTKLWIRNVTTDGLDAHAALMAVAVGTTLYVQDKSDHTLAATFDTTGAPIDKSTYVELPVIAVSASGALLNNQAVIVAAIPSGTGPSPSPGAPLVTVAEAKIHLRLYSPDAEDNDPDVSAKLAAAQGVILDYCAASAYWAPLVAGWDASSVPLPVKQAILLELGELYRFRGDDAETPARWDDHDLAPAIVGLLRRSRDPVVA